MSAATHFINGFVPRETESSDKTSPQQLNPPDSMPVVTNEELGKLRLNELCALWMEGRL